jgi:hypothetical protein
MAWCGVQAACLHTCLPVCLSASAACLHCVSPALSCTACRLHCCPALSCTACRPALPACCPALRAALLPCTVLLPPVGELRACLTLVSLSSTTLPLPPPFSRRPPSLPSSRPSTGSPAIPHHATVACVIASLFWHGLTCVTWPGPHRFWLTWPRSAASTGWSWA